MKLPPQIEPYALLIKAGLIAIVLFVSFLGGCHVQGNRDNDKIAGLNHQVSVLLDANKSFENTAKLQADQIKREQKAASDLKKQADAGAKALAKEAADTQSKLDKANAQLAKALKDPGCKSLLEAQVCSAIPLP